MTTQNTMTKSKRIRTFARALVWSQLRAQGYRQFILPFGLGILFLGANVVASQHPGILTLTSEAAIRDLVNRYFTDISGDAFIIGLLVVQGPYLLSVFTAVVGVRVGESLVESDIDSGRFEQYLNLPYRTTELYQSFILGSLTLALLQTLVIGVIAIGGSLALLVTKGVTFASSIGSVLYVSFLIPIPMALWATLVVIAIGLWSGSSSGTGDVGDLLKIVAVAPALSGVVAISVQPGISLALLTAGLLSFAVVSVVVMSAAMGRWFEPESVLRTT